MVSSNVPARVASLVNEPSAKVFSGPACPLCLSIDTHPNKIRNASIDDVAAAVWAAHRGGRMARGLRVLGGWACIEVANALREPWRCDYCGHSFREAGHGA